MVILHTGTLQHTTAMFSWGREAHVTNFHFPSRIFTFGYSNVNLACLYNHQNLLGIAIFFVEIDEQQCTISHIYVLHLRPGMFFNLLKSFMYMSPLFIIYNNHLYYFWFFFPLWNTFALLVFPQKSALKEICWMIINRKKWRLYIHKHHSEIEKRKDYRQKIATVVMETVWNFLDCFIS